MGDIIAIGHDIIKIDRIAVAHKKYDQKFLEKIYTEKELQYCLNKRNPYPSLAARFAVKEAISKAFGCGIGLDFRWHSASTINDSNGKPTVILDDAGNRLMKKFNAKTILLSLTHTSDVASAMVILVK